MKRIDYKIGLDSGQLENGTRTINGFHQAANVLSSALSGDFVSAARGAGGSVRTLLSTMSAFPLATGVALAGAAIGAAFKAAENQAAKVLEKTKALTSRFMEVARSARAAFADIETLEAKKAGKLDRDQDIEGAKANMVSSGKRLEDAKVKYAATLGMAPSSLDGDTRSRNKYLSTLSSAKTEMITAKKIHDMYSEVYEKIAEDRKKADRDATDQALDDIDEIGQRLAQLEMERKGTEEPRMRVMAEAAENNAKITREEAKRAGKEGDPIWTAREMKYTLQAAEYTKRADELKEQRENAAKEKASVEAAARSDLARAKYERLTDEEKLARVEGNLPRMRAAWQAEQDPEKRRQIAQNIIAGLGERGRLKESIGDKEPIRQSRIADIQGEMAELKKPRATGIDLGQAFDLARGGGQSPEEQTAKSTAKMVELQKELNSLMKGAPR